MHMSIYEEQNSLPKYSFSYSKLKFPVIAFIAVLVIAFLVISSLSLFEPDPLLVSFEEQVFDLNEKNSLLMKAVVVNVLQEDVRDSVIKVSPVDEKALTVFPKEIQVEVLGQGESRAYNFNVRVLNEEIPSGNYEIQIGFLAGGHLYIKRVSVYIKNN